ncbi:chorismate binding enzyme domain protein [Synechococcus sp. PCC 7335]|uniref:chorismate-binding protein n=1 Tax=Synechococcus sp. (strain ATCC 29403 / PCC 7335) TaxID=91464 RepID=UPI00017EC7D3|nr:chorismate-binding protein [Synechococcus sp. PCC 7335]EDX84582.1 chorismate binding enzyme domain protein [Synechococcus sp. PCC 7335]
MPLEERTGSDVFAVLFEPQTAQPGPAGIATLLESPHPLPDDFSSNQSVSSQVAKLARYSICAGPPRSVDSQTQLWTPQIGHIVPFLEQLGTVEAPRSAVLIEKKLAKDVLPEQLPFIGGWLGWLGYDLAWEIEQLPWLKEDALPFPVAFWYEPTEFAVVDHQLQRVWLAAESIDQLFDLSTKFLNAKLPTKVGSTGSIVSSIPEQDDFGKTSPPVSPSSIYEGSIYEGYRRGDRDKGIGWKYINAENKDRNQSGQRTQSLRLETQKAEFMAAVAKAKAHIKAGDVFQVNHSLRFQAQTTADSWSVYQALHTINPSPFASYWHTPWGSVVSCSPERLVQAEGGRAQTRPIAGTRPRGQHRYEDENYAKQLRGDRKEQAEHIMLVDLERNDLGRVCQWGTVQVEELMTIERYSHVMHLVSNIVGKLTPECSMAQLIVALFPGGTITGCPKVRCMEIIEALEPVRRSLFYGSCGYLDRRGRLDLNILIRTLLLSTLDKSDSPDSATTVWGQVGAGIVADSEPEKEWVESLQKAKAQLLALGL